MHAATITGGILAASDTTGTNARPSAVTITLRTNLLAGTLTATNNLIVGHNASIAGTLRVIGTLTNDAIQPVEVVVGGADKTLASVAHGNTGDVLTSNGAGVAPSFQPPTGGGGGTNFWTNTAPNVINADATISFGLNGAGNGTLTTDTNGTIQATSSVSSNGIALSLFSSNASTYIPDIGGIVISNEIGMVFLVGGDDSDDNGPYVFPAIDVSNQEYLNGDAVGFWALHNGSISNYIYVSAHGALAGYNSHISNGRKINLYGVFSGAGAHLDGDNIDAWGLNTLANATLTGVDIVSAFGPTALSGATLDASSSIDAWGSGALGGIYLTNSTLIAGFGSSTLNNAQLTNAAHILALGDSSGGSLAGDGLHNITMIGTPSNLATNSDDFIVGNGNNHYFFPGPTASIAGTLQTAKPTGGTNTVPFKVGEHVAGTFALQTTNCILIEINGVTYKLATVQ